MLLTRLLPAPRGGIPAFRRWEPEIAPQGGTLVFGAEEISTLQLRYDAIDKVVKAARKIGHDDVETVGCPSLHPFLHPIGDLHRRAYHFKVPARAGESFVQLANSQIFPLRHRDHHIRPAGDNIVLGKFGQRTIERIAGEVKSNSPRQQSETDVGMDEILHAFVFLLCFVGGPPDGDGKPGMIFRWSGLRPYFAMRPLTSA